MLAPFIRLCADSSPACLGQRVFGPHSTSHLPDARRAIVAVLQPTLPLVPSGSTPVWQGLLPWRDVVCARSFCHQVWVVPLPLVWLFGLQRFWVRVLSSKLAHWPDGFVVPDCCAPSTINLPPPGQLKR